MRSYETTFIIGGLLDVAEREALIGRYEKSLTKLGGKFERIVRWGQRNLAYEIKKRTQGYYVIFYFKADPSIISSFHRQLDINENILRYMTLLWDGKHPEYIKDEGESVSGVDVPSKVPVTAKNHEDSEDTLLSEIDEDTEVPDDVTGSEKEESGDSSEKYEDTEETQDENDSKETDEAENLDKEDK
ncbi:30S ribosomal protein S6 [Candidatus Latescibacterota bacterium]